MTAAGRSADVVIVGAGLAGLAAACHLTKAGKSVAVLEAADGVGGRVRTDVVDGFRLDRGFQVLLTAYPEAVALFDYSALDLRAYEPGARIRAGDKWMTIADPWRRPGLAMATAVSGVGTIADKIRLARLAARVKSDGPRDRYRRPEMTTAAFLVEAGFSEQVITRFFQPFFGGIFLDASLSASSRMFEFLYRMFGVGDAAIPAGGMQALPDQLASRLPAGSLIFGARVARVEAGSVELATGEIYRGQAVVVAAGAGLADLVRGRRPVRWRGVSCLHFAAPAAPEAVGRFLVLNGEGRGPINNLSVPSVVAPMQAPPGQSLVSVTVLGADRAGTVLEPLVRAQLVEWFGDRVRGWRLLRADRIVEALPVQTPPWYTKPEWPVRLRQGLYVAGDLIDTASIDGALKSGRLAAEALLEDRDRSRRGSNPGR